MKADKRITAPPDLVPLFRFLGLLQCNGFALGLDDYFALLAVLVAGNGIADRSRLLLICKLLWLKNQEQEPLFRSLFHKAWEQERIEIDKWQATYAQVQLERRKRKNPETELERSKQPSVATSTSPKTETNALPDQQKDPPPQSPDIHKSKPVYGTVQISIESSQVASNLTVEKDQISEAQQNYLISGSWLEVKDRDLIQRFRFLRRLESHGNRATIDLPATVRKISGEGQFLEPVWESDRRNIARIIVLVDHEGSMVAFGELADIIARSASMSQNFKNDTFYFNNLPVDYVWRNKAHTDSVSVNYIHEVLKKPNTWLLIVSDGGAARGRYDIARIDATAKWLSDLPSASRRIAWINPLPVWRWPNTSAAAIAQMVTMFAATPQGIRNAVRFFKGSSFKMT